MHQAWFLDDTGYVHMGSGIRCSSGSPLHTTLASRLLGAGAQVHVGLGGSTAALPHGNHSFAIDGAGAARWVHHSYADPGGADPAGVGWALLPAAAEDGAAPPAGDVAALAVHASNRTGDWAALGTSTGTPTLETFELVWRHAAGACAASAASTPPVFAYRVTVGVRPSELPAAAAAAAGSVVANGEDVQAVYDPVARVLRAVLWAAGVAVPAASAGWAASASAPCILLVAEEGGGVRVSASSPTLHGELRVSLDRALRGANCSAQPAGNGTDFTLWLPGADLLGQTRSVLCA